MPHGAEVRAASGQEVPEEEADAVQQGAQDASQEVPEVPLHFVYLLCCLFVVYYLFIAYHLCADGMSQGVKLFIFLLGRRRSAN